MLESWVMRLEPGAQFDRYVIEGLLGKGGMGQVYRAFDARLERRVALKILAARPDEPDFDPSVSVRRILREARAAAALDHPNTVAVFEVGEHQGVPFMAMELIQGRSLRSFIGEPSIPLEQRIAWLLEVGKALEAAHRAGIVHLDVKPENVMVRDGGGIKVLDFGVARRHAHAIDVDREHASGPASMAMLTQGGKLAGTVPYMAPEQIKLQKVDGRTDQFAWGVLAYELISSRMPWPVDEGSYPLVSAILEGKPPPLRDLVPDVSADVEAVINRSLEKRPMDRFASMDELVFTLAEVAPAYRPLRSLLPASITPIATERPSDKALADTRLDSHVVDELFEKTIEDPSALRATTPSPTAAAETTAVTRSTLASGIPPAPKTIDENESPRATSSGEQPRPTQLTPPPVASADSPPDKPLARRALMGLAAAALTTALVLVGRGLPSGEVKPAASASAQASTAAPAPKVVPTTVTDLAAPTSCDPSALREYQTGLQALRDGVWDQAHASFERAATKDETCGAFFVRLSITGFYYYPISKAREVYNRAMKQRASLSERDRLVLEALDPLIRTDPSNARETGERFVALSDRFPGDAEIAFLASRLSHVPERKLEYARRALALDEKYSDAWQMLAEGFAAERKFTDAIDALERCVNAVPASIDCVRTRAMLLRRSGRCEEAAATARTWIARDSSTPNGYFALAHAVAQSETRPALEEALRQRWSKLSDDDRPKRTLHEQALVEALYGQFDAAERRARELDKLVEASPNLEAHALPKSLLVEILVETGRASEAGKTAAESIDRATAWSSSFSSESLEASVYSFEPRLLAVAHHAGKIDEPTYKRRLEAWSRATQNGRITGEDAIWALASAMQVDTPAQAREALAKMPLSVQNNGRQLGLWSVIWGPFAGRALYLDGELDTAIDQLRASTAACNAFIEPFIHTRAYLWLGEALEKKGDREGACKAYAVIDRRWGHATPRSITAQIAEERRASLGCSR